MSSDYVQVRLPALLVFAVLAACGAEPESDKQPGATARTSTQSSTPSPSTPEPSVPSPSAPSPSAPSTSASQTQTPRARQLRGVDASHHQGEIDWVRVRRDRISFAYLKATEASTFTDPRFMAHAQAAKQAGLRVGGYHYFSLCSPGAAQAEHFAGVLDSAGARSLPPAIDLELLGNCSDPPAREDLLREIRVFIDIVERRTDQRIVVYAYPEFEASYRIATALQRRQWVRRIGSTPPTRDWWIWQRDDHATVDGISGPADLNVMVP